MSRASWTVLAVVAALLGLVTIGAAVMTDAPRSNRVTNEAGGAACFKREDFDEYTRAALYARKTRNVSWMKAMYESGACVRLPIGERVTVLDYEWSGVSRVALHPPEGGQAIPLWTANENID